MKKLLLLISIHLFINSYGQTKKSEELFEKGKELFLAQDYQQAIKVLNEVIKLSPTWSKAYNGRAAIYIEEKKYNKALIDLNKSIELEPNEKAFLNRGYVYENLLDTNAALIDYDKAIELNPNFAKVYFSISILKLALKDFNAADQAIVKAIRINPEPDYLELHQRIKNEMKNMTKYKKQTASTNSSASNDKKIEKNPNINANDNEKTVTLTVSGQGATQNEARQKALRSAIEQAFGTFISSKTEILNDNLVKDEIVSVANGNIQKFEPMSEVQLPDGGYASTLKATVSVTKLTSFCESKGVEVEFKGAMFAMNIKLQKLNEEAEYNAVLNLCQTSREILKNSLDFGLETSDPISVDGRSDVFSVEFKVKAIPNQNLKKLHDYFYKTLEKISLDSGEVNNYNSLNKYKFPIVYFYDTLLHIPQIIHKEIYEKEVIENEKILQRIYLRNPKSVSAIKYFLTQSTQICYNFRIISEVDTILADYKNKFSFSLLPYYFGYKTDNFGSYRSIKISKLYLSVLNRIEDKRLRKSFISHSSNVITFDDFINKIFISKYNWSSQTIDPFHYSYVWSDRINMPDIIESSTDYPIFYNIAKVNELENSFILNINYKTTLDKLEKISKYRIEPLLNSQ